MTENMKNPDDSLLEPPSAVVLSSPFFLYLIGTSLVGMLDRSYYPLGYAAVALAVAIACWALFRGRKLIVPHARIGIGVLFGLIGIAIWIGLSELRLEEYLPVWLRGEKRAGFNPFGELSYGVACCFLAVRIFGIALLVPIAEEVFWRGFVLRWAIGEKWQELPIGTFQWQAFAVGTLGFTLVHPEWLAAAVYAILLNTLICWKKDLWLCIVAHAVSNFALVVYVLLTESWWLW